MELELRLAAQERDLGAVTESSGAVLEEVGDLSSAVSQIWEIILQIAEAVNQDSQLRVQTVSGANVDSRRERDEVSVSSNDLHMAWKQRGAKKHWVVRACVNLGVFETSVAEVHSALRESVRFTTSIADQGYPSTVGHHTHCDRRQDRKVLNNDSNSTQPEPLPLSPLTSFDSAPRKRVKNTPSRNWYAFNPRNRT